MPSIGLGLEGGLAFWLEVEAELALEVLWLVGLCRGALCNAMAEDAFA